MLYFYLWCLFLLCVILAVPMAAFYEKRKLPPLRPMAEDGFGGEEPMEEGAFGEEGGEMADEGVELEPAEEGAFGGGGEEDFPEFDEEFK